MLEHARPFHPRCGPEQSGVRPHYRTANFLKFIGPRRAYASRREVYLSVMASLSIFVSSSSRRVNRSQTRIHIPTLVLLCVSWTLELSGTRNKSGLRYAGLLVYKQGGQSSRISTLGTGSSSRTTGLLMTGSRARMLERGPRCDRGLGEGQRIQQEVASNPTAPQGGVLMMPMTKRPLLATPWHEGCQCLQPSPLSLFPEQHPRPSSRNSGLAQSTFSRLACMWLLQRKVRLVHKCIPASLVQLPTPFRHVPHDSQYNIKVRISVSHQPSGCVVG